MWTFGILTALLAAVWMTRSLVQRRRAPRSIRRGRQLVEVIDTSRIDEQLTVHVLRVGTRALVVGLSPGGLATLTEFDDANTVSDRPAHTSEQPKPPPLFRGDRPIGHSINRHAVHAPESPGPHRVRERTQSVNST